MGILGWRYTISASTNLADWVPLASFTSTNVTTPIVDSSGGNPSRRFYRASAP